MLSSSDKFGYQNESVDFVQENDTVLVSYCFWGENAPVTITVCNKLGEPIYVDWKRYAMIIDDAMVPYAQKEISDRECARKGKEQENALKTTAFIAPHVKLVTTPSPIDNFCFEAISKDGFAKK